MAVVAAAADEERASHKFVVADNVIHFALATLKLTVHLKGNSRSGSR
jgi:hypothetical protein